MIKRGTLCGIIGASLLHLANAETFNSKEELLLKYAPRFEQTTKELEEKGFDVAPIQAYFAFGSAEVNQAYANNGTYLHDEGKSYQTYGAFPVSFTELARWGPNVDYHPNDEGLSKKDFNNKIRTDTDFNVKMTAIRLSGMTNGNPKDKGMSYIKKRFLPEVLTDVEEGYLISYIGNKGTSGLKTNYDRVKSGEYNFANKERGPNTRKGIKLAKIYTSDRN